MRHSLTEATRDVATRALQRWGERDLDGTLELIAEDVVHVLNIDGNLAPFAKSVAGKADLRPKLRGAIEAAALGLTTRLKDTSLSLANWI